MVFLVDAQTKRVSMPTLPSPCLRRVFGFSPVVQINCSHTWKLVVHSDRKWYHFVNPIMLLVLYYTVATLIRLWLQEPLDPPTVRTEMLSTLWASVVKTRWHKVAPVAPVYLHLKKQQTSSWSNSDWPSDTSQRDSSVHFRQRAEIEPRLN